LDKIKAIIGDHEFNKAYGVRRMFEALTEQGEKTSKSTVQRTMKRNGLVKVKKRRPNSLTKADKQAQKSDDLLKRDFSAAKPEVKYVTDITEYPTADGKLYVSGLFDCYDNVCAGVAMDDNMERWLPINMLRDARSKYDLTGAIVHTDRGSQYTSADYRSELARLGIIQSMNSAAGRCYDNAKCESMWGRAKTEILELYDTSKMSMADVKTLVFYYYMGYWNTKRICSAIGGTTPYNKRAKYRESQNAA